MTITPGNWIAYQNPSQEKHGHWSVGIENQYGIHGVGSGEHRDVSFDVGGICTEADARAMAAAKDAIYAIKLALEYWQHRQQRYRNRAPVWVQEARAVLAKAGAQ